MGNQGKMAGRFVLEFKARYFFLNSYIWNFLFEKSNLLVQRNNTLNLECKEVRDPICDGIHNYSISPCQTPFWNMSLAVRTKQWTARNLQKLCADRDPVPTFLPENKVSTLFSGTGTMPEF